MSKGFGDTWGDHSTEELGCWHCTAHLAHLALTSIQHALSLLSRALFTQPVPFPGVSIQLGEFKGDPGSPRLQLRGLFHSPWLNGSFIPVWAWNPEGIPFVSAWNIFHFKRIVVLDNGIKQSLAGSPE